ncbi:unnamed protein product [Meganyctiphanes norvegica]|uniref:Ninjurin-2 n=1 Tax=Meganyctiphanes norvegica TaxID=48144 RepID=A0AAV2PH88_MEGNR
MSDRLFTPTEKFKTMSVQPINGGTKGTGKGVDANNYVVKKTIAQGMLDIALLTANASQLKYVLTVGEKHEFYSLMLILIGLSLILQVLAGILFLVIGGLNINDPSQQRSADILNNVTLVLVFLISLDNVIINSFGIEQQNLHQPGTPWEEVPKGEL